MFWRRDYPTDEEVAEFLEGIDIVEAADLDHCHRRDGLADGEDQERPKVAEREVAKV